uniref:Uncharacterized protein n=1 Tax=Fagus sylvatica TaxID=28930 RepID=A0A2N9ESB3_FAGSY
MAAKSTEVEHPKRASGWAARDTSGLLSPFEFSRRATGEKDITFKVLYCGICHSDLHMVKNEFGMSTYPFVPGHEIVGVVTEVGSNVQKFNVGDKVGVGCMVGACRSCDNCANNLENYCPGMIFTYGVKNFDGTTTHVYSPLKFYGLDKPGMHVGVVGLGGLGHVAVKFAKAMGVKVAQGTLDGIIDTVAVVHPLLPLIGLLKSHGKLVMVGAPDKPLELPIFPLIMGRRIVGGSCIGGMKETQEMVDFAAKHNITADIEVIPIDYVNTAMERLLKADVRYRFVIDIGNTLKSSS